jgi:hypothetical protein
LASIISQRFAFGQVVWDPGNTNTFQSGGQQGNAILGLEAPLRTNGADQLSIHDLPAFGSLHESLVKEKVYGVSGAPCASI